MRAELSLLVLASLLVAGCAAPAGVGDAGRSAATEEDAASRPVVVAVIDTGINPYHVVFRGPGFETLAAFPEDALVLELALDAADYASALAADEEDWARVEEGTLVRFPGTRVAGVSFGKDIASTSPLGAPEGGPFYVLDEAGHGTPVAASVAAAAPQALLLMLQVPDDEQIADAMRWAAQREWIDIVTVSSATWITEYLQGEGSMGLPAAYAEAYRSGKLILNGAGNEPIPHLIGEHSGPSFIVAVGGAENESRGETRFAARFPDVISDFEQVRALPHTMEETGVVGGTSFSTPLVAGVAAEALRLAREAGADPTADELRAALQAAAEAWGPTDYDPLSEPEQVVYSNPVLIPGAQTGWGYLATQHAPLAADILLGAPAPAKPAVAAFMAAREQARRAVWGA